MTKIRETLDKYSINELYEVVRKVKDEKEAEKILKQKGVKWKSKKSTKLFGGSVTFEYIYRPVATYHVEDQTLEIYTID